MARPSQSIIEAGTTATTDGVIVNGGTTRGVVATGMATAAGMAIVGECVQ
jgi:hypothetical protein